jgi:hypothetical protein
VNGGFVAVGPFSRLYGSDRVPLWVFRSDHTLAGTGRRAVLDFD